MASQTADQIRAHTALSDLYQYGRNLGATEGGTQAQALAWVIGANRFMAVEQVPPPAKSLVAEPLFSALLNVPAPAPVAGRMVPSYNEYLAAAARSVSATSAKAGATVGRWWRTGRSERKSQPHAGRQNHRRAIAGSRQQLPFTSPLRSEVDRTTAGLNALEAAAATTPPATQHKGSTQQKPKPAPTQNPKKQPTQ
jgi:hypothetical protein